MRALRVGHWHKWGGMYDRAEPWMALALSAAVVVAGALEQLAGHRPAYAENFAPRWVPLAAVGLAAAGLMPFNGSPLWLRVRQMLRWGGLLLMVWTASGLPLDLLRIIPGLMPPGVDWPGLATRTLALAAAVVLARLALARPDAPASSPASSWYGYAAFVLALPYPVLRTCWALGGTLGLEWPGAAGEGFAPWLASIPWLLAAALSLLLVPAWRWMPRRLLLTAGWSATAVVAMIGPAACWSLVAKLATGGDPGLEGIAVWVPGLFYGSWLLWAIAAGAATRSYQLRSAALRMRIPGGTEHHVGVLARKASEPPDRARGIGELDAETPVSEHGGRQPRGPDSRHIQGCDAVEG